jgi:hypothetical protein
VFVEQPEAVIIAEDELLRYSSDFVMDYFDPLTNGTTG